MPFSSASAARRTGYAQVAEWFSELPSGLKRAILVILGLVVVVLPALLYDTATRAAYDAARWVSHTYLVEARCYRLLFDMRDTESILRTRIVGLQGAEKPPASPADALHEDLLEIQQLTLDNPRQQERLGQLRVILDTRLDTLQDGVRLAQTGHPKEGLDKINEVIRNYPFRALTDQILAEERGLLEGRLRTTSHRQHLASTLIWGAVFAQFLLGGTLYLASERDLARRRAAEDLSREASAHAETIVEINPDPLAVLDRHGRVRHVNRAFTNLYGVPAATARGLFLRDLGQGAWDLPELQQRLADLVPQNREIWDWEVTQPVPGGETRVMLLNARTFPGMGGQRLILLSAKDVTGRKKTEEQITRLNQELSLRVDQTQAINQELEAFSYSVSHDLRAPLRHITGFGDLLKTHLGKAAPDPKTERYLGYILESSTQMGALIDDLLVFSRMGRAEMTQEEVDMAALVQEVVRYHQLETEGRKVRFNIAPLPPIRGDAAMLRQVWANLVGNAIKYSRTREEAVVEIGCQAAEAERVYFVKDNGVGFNMKYAHKLFGVFQRLHQADEYEGTGIGLANVRRIVLRHGGKVWAESALDQGAAFFFSLPLNPPAAAAQVTPTGVPINGPVPTPAIA